jgi:hypothetical protein
MLAAMLSPAADAELRLRGAGCRCMRPYISARCAAADADADTEADAGADSVWQGHPLKAASERATYMLARLTGSGATVSATYKDVDRYQLLLC